MDVQDVVKPSRSEGGESFTAEEQANHAQQLQQFLSATAHHRAHKPGRSEPQDGGELEVPSDACSEELHRFQELEVNGEPLHTEGGVVNDDSYVDTPYYADLNSVDKSLHHETGTGFITGTVGEGYYFSVGDGAESVFKTSNKRNPATNEWEPSPVEDNPIETKVHRSDP